MLASAARESSGTYPLSQAADKSKGGAPEGNQNAVRAKRCREALLKALGEHGKGDVDKGLAKICKQVVKLADKGEQWAVQELFNRLDGRVPAGVELTGANGGELVIRDASTSIGVARRVAFALAHGAMVAANDGTEAKRAGAA